MTNQDSAMLYEGIIRRAYGCNRRGFPNGMPGADQDVFSALWRLNGTDLSFQTGKVVAFLSDAIWQLIRTANMTEDKKKALEKACEDYLLGEPTPGQIEECILKVADIIKPI